MSETSWVTAELCQGCMGERDSRECFCLGFLGLFQLCWNRKWQQKGNLNSLLNDKRTVQWRRWLMIADVRSSNSTVRVKKNIWLCFSYYFPPHTHPLCLTWAKGPGNKTIIPSVNDGPWPRGRQLRLQVRSDHLRFPFQPPHSSPAFTSSVPFSHNSPQGSLWHLTTLQVDIIEMEKKTWTT